MTTFNTEVSNAYELSKRYEGAQFVAGEGFAVFMEQLLRRRSTTELLLPGGLTKYDTLVRHPLYAILGYLMSKQGFGFDLTKFRTYEDFRRVITPRLLSRIVIMVIKTGLS